MSGVEVVAIVTAVVSGFASAVKLYETWHAMKAIDAGKTTTTVILPSSPLDATENQARPRTRLYELLKSRRAKETTASSVANAGVTKTSNVSTTSTDAVKNSLSSSGPLVKREYDTNFAILGKKFAVGDEIGKTQMQSYLITLQQSVIILLNNALSGKATNVSMSRLLATSDAVRKGSLRVLVEQFQRMSIAAPISKNPNLPTSITAAERARRYEEYCPAALAQQMSGIGQHPRDLACKACLWAHKGYPPGDMQKFKIDIDKPVTQTSESIYTPSIRLFAKSHLLIEKDTHNRKLPSGMQYPVYGCIICDKAGNIVNFSHANHLIQHLGTNHGLKDLAREVDVLCTTI